MSVRDNANGPEGLYILLRFLYVWVYISYASTRCIIAMCLMLLADYIKHRINLMPNCFNHWLSYIY